MVETSSETTNNKLQVALNIETNKICADCDSSQITHLSVQNGVTLCETCADYHTDNLPRETHSWVRALSLKNWREDQIQGFLMGGNKRINDYLADFDLYMDIQAKYSSKAACHYRKHICQKNIPKLIDTGDFVLVDDDASKLVEDEQHLSDFFKDGNETNSLSQSLNLAEQDQAEIEASKGLMTLPPTKIEKTKEKLGSWWGMTKTKIASLEMGRRAKETGSELGQSASSLGQSASQSFTKLRQSETAQKTKSGFFKLGSKIKSLFESDDEEIGTSSQNNNKQQEANSQQIMDPQSAIVQQQAQTYISWLGSGGTEKDKAVQQSSQQIEDSNSEEEDKEEEQKNVYQEIIKSTATIEYRYPVDEEQQQLSSSITEQDKQNFLAQVAKNEEQAASLVEQKQDQIQQANNNDDDDQLVDVVEQQVPVSMQPLLDDTSDNEQEQSKQQENETDHNLS